MALSTAQACALFDKASSCLASIEAKADADSAAAAACMLQLNNYLESLKKGFASPHSTWQKLLQHQVRHNRCSCTTRMRQTSHACSQPPTTARLLLHLPLQVPSTVLAACCSLVTSQQDTPWSVVTYAAASTAHCLISMADKELSTASVGSSKSSKLSAMFTAQLEQSGFLQLLPGLLSRFTEAVQADTATQDFSASECTAFQAQQLVELVACMSGLHGGFAFFKGRLGTHAAGPALVEPVLQLPHIGMQYISRALQQLGRQDWMDAWLRAARNIAGVAAAAAETAESLNNGSGDGQPSSGSGDDSGSGSAFTSTAACTG